MTGAIESQRLLLVTMTREFLEACRRPDASRAGELIGLDVPQDWLNDEWLIDLRLADLQRDPTLEPWLLRAIVLRGTREMVGHIGFHSKPGAEYLQPWAPAGVELGYTIFAAHRRQGYATEACQTLMEWAVRAHGVKRIVVSIGPENEPSLKIAKRLGFRKVGSHLDEIDGPEDVFVWEVASSNL